MIIRGLQKTTLLDYPGMVASTIFTGGCNFRCPYCHNGDLVLSPADIPAISEDEIFSHINEKKKILDGICITGGEPTLNADLLDFIKKIKATGLLVKLDTNGTNPDMLASLIDEKLLDYVAMDIKHSREKYNTIACMNNFDIAPIEKSVEILKSSGIDYEFRTTLVNELHSAEDIKSIGHWLKGAKAYYLQSYKESEYVINPIFSAPLPATVLEYVSLLKEYIPNVQARGLD